MCVIVSLRREDTSSGIQDALQRAIRWFLTCNSDTSGVSRYLHRGRICYSNCNHQETGQCKSQRTPWCRSFKQLTVTQLVK